MVSKIYVQKSQYLDICPAGPGPARRLTMGIFEADYVGLHWVQI